MKKYLQTRVLVLVCTFAVTVCPAGLTTAADKTTANSNLDRLIKTKSCKNCDLSGLSLNRLELAEADLEGADLSSAKISLTNLAKANLRNTNLRGAVFGGSDLSDADLRGADLRGASLDSSYYEGARFDGEFIATKPLADLGETGIEKDVYVADTVKPKPLPEKGEVKLNERRDLLEEPLGAAVEEVQPKTVSLKKTKTGDTTKIAETGATASGPIAKRVAPVRQAIVDDASQDGQLASEVISSLNSSKEHDEKLQTVEEVKSNPSQQVMSKPSEQKAKNVEPSVTPANSTVAAKEKEKQQSIPTQVLRVTENKNDQKQVTPSSAASPIDSRQQAKKETKTSSEAQSTPASSVIAKVAEKKSSDKSRVESSSKEPVVDKKKEDNLQTLLDKNRCFACDLSGLDLSGRNLDGADLEKANLSNCNLEKADLDTANLKGALLLKANLRQASLTDADFYKADLSGADLTGAKLAGAMFDSAQTASAVGLSEAIQAAVK